MIYFNKVLPILISPLGIISAFIILGFISRKMVYPFIGLALLWLFSLPIVSSSLIGFLEKNYSIESSGSISEHKTVVVLSGMVVTLKHSNQIHYEFSEAVDRILAGIELLKLGKAKKIILTRGHLPWSKGEREGEFLSKFAQSYGINPKDIVLTPTVQNTDDEAKAISQMIPRNERIILVTSAFHMPRAQAVFENQDIQITPFPVDFRNGTKKVDMLDFLPQSNALKDSSMFVREMIGRFYYALKY
tara:strand:- start:519 stop:1256 length:738 start_codon:yes stop_codon:yes gene_type:complete